MIISILFASSILAVAILSWLFRQRLALCLRKETMRTAGLFAAVALLLLVVLLPDICLLAYTLSLMPHSFRIVLALAAAATVCVGCWKSQPAAPAPALIHWKGQDGGYEDTTALPPKAASQ
jgi:hypothetical protein